MKDKRVCNAPSGHPERREGSPDGRTVPTHRRSLTLTTLGFGMTRWGVTRILLLCLGMCFSLTASAEVENLGQMATWITGSFGTLAKLITAVAYLLGLMFSLGAVFKMRQHRDNPTQIPVGTPFILLFIASALLFFSNTLKITGRAVFGTTQSQGASGTGR